MRHLVWIKRKNQADEWADGLLILLLVILIPFSLKAFFINQALQRSLCDENMYVQVEGDIRYPGIYPFCGKINLAQLINRGGGLVPGDYPASISDNIPLEPGVRVNIKGDGTEWRFFQDGISAFHKIALGIPISINRESEDGLTAIPGIGPKLAEEILRERNKRGGFKDLSEIKSVYGIGDKMYERIVPYVKL
ncbi:helix-hairpin-helix domain-containing protein [Deltaproteobacteria bacterium]|nr:helix-hairpin-helix domain-containing protein [Deltaproteobacteria bacterium]